MLDAFITSMIEIAGMMAAIYAVQVLLRMREEEVRGRLEPVLAGAVTRPRWVAGYVLTAGLGAAVLLWPSPSAMALTAGRSWATPPDLLGDLTGAALAQLPACPGHRRRGGRGLRAGAALGGPVSWLLLGASILLSPVFGTQPRPARVGAGHLALHAPEGAGARDRQRRDRRPARHRRGARRGGPRGVPPPRPHRMTLMSPSRSQAASGPVSRHQQAGAGLLTRGRALRHPGEITG